MGFFQRFLSLGSRKNKKRRAALVSASTTGFDTRTTERELEVEVSKLLRSSSTHFTVVSEADYATLPPLPHPINGFGTTPVPSPGRSTVQSRGRTYSVKILGERKVLATTEFPNANPPMHTPPRRLDDGGYRDSGVADVRERQITDIIPRDQSRIHGLRQDPSVASLLNMYDDHGHIDSQIFSNSPTKQGRAQIQRSGSTLRQLLGGSDEADIRLRNSVTEGDISWAERFLLEGEDSEDNASSASEPDTPLDTPKDFTCTTEPAVHVPDPTNATISTENDTSMNCSDLNSLEVEFSATSDGKPETLNLALSSREPTTPSRPASEVFGFLLERRKSAKKATVEPHGSPERPLPALPTSTNFTDDSPNPATPPYPDQPSPSPSHANTSHSTDAPSSVGSIFEDPPSCAQIMNRTPVLLTSDTARSQQLSIPHVPASRIPRGPRGPRTSVHVKSQSTGSTVQSVSSSQPASSTGTVRDAPKVPRVHIDQRDTLRSTAGVNLTQVKADVYTPVPARKAQRRVASASGAKPAQGGPASSRHSIARKAANKENDNDASLLASAKSRLPVTPVHQRSLLMASHSAAPSPASSSELSPVGQRMMTQLRSQRKAGKNRFAEFALHD